MGNPQLACSVPNHPLPNYLLDPIGSGLPPGGIPALEHPDPWSGAIGLAAEGVQFLRHCHFGIATKGEGSHPRLTAPVHPGRWPRPTCPPPAARAWPLPSFSNPQRMHPVAQAQPLASGAPSLPSASYCHHTTRAAVPSPSSRRGTGRGFAAPTDWHTDLPLCRVDPPNTSKSSRVRPLTTRRKQSVSHAVEPRNKLRRKV